MKLKFFIILFFVSVSLLGYSQNISKAFEALNNKDFKTAKQIFSEKKKSDKYKALSYYGLALVYSNTEYKYYNFSLAKRYLSYSNKYYKKLKPSLKNKYEKKYNFSQNSIDETDKKIRQQAYWDAIKNPSKKKYDDFLKNYPDSEYKEKIEFLRDSLAFAQATASGSVYDIKSFLARNKDSRYYDKADSIYNAKLQNIYRKAVSNLNYKDLKIIKNDFPDFAQKQDSLNIYLDWAYSFENLPAYKDEEAVKQKFDDFFKKANSHPLAMKVLQIIVDKYQDNDPYKKIETLNRYKQFFSGENLIEINQEIKQIENQKNAVQYKAQSFSNVINTPYNEYYPVLSVDAKTLYFCSNNNPQGNGNEDIFVSYYKNGSWTKPKLEKALSDPIANDAILTVSADGNNVLLFRSGKIYQVHKTVDGWSEPEEFDALNIGVWNADAYYTADGKAILFASVRPENIGGEGDWFTRNTDIYVIEKQDDGTWSEPINLGSTINTSDLERTPFLHPDMRTLYFSSAGHGGQGGLDVFKSVRLSENSWTEWSKPVNLGKNINTPEDDYAFKITTDGTEAIFHTRTSNGDMDIMKIKLNENQRPDVKVLTVSGKVYDENHNILQADIIWENLETGEQLGHLQSDPKSGNYIITLPLGKNYGFYVSKKGYYPLSDNVDLRNKTDFAPITKDFQLTSIQKIKTGETAITLNNIFFDTDKYDLKKESYPELNRLVQFIKENPDIKIEISGHTDNVGTSQYNKQLSQKRADAVKKYLVSQGCPADRLISVGYGESKPIASNSTDKGKAQNRRVEFRVIK